MTQTDRVISNIGAIMTMLENFPNGLFDADGKTYSSCIEFLFDILRSCGTKDKEILEFLLGKIYGFEGKPGYTINGLYELIKSGNLDINMQNDVIKYLELSIKIILMGLLSSIYTCSAIPILPNYVFDLDNLEELMDVEIQDGVKVGGDWEDLKIRIPIPLIDLTDMLSISPVSSNGRIYYNSYGGDNYYKKLLIETPKMEEVQKMINPGDTYFSSVTKYHEIHFLNMVERGDVQLTDSNGNNFNAKQYCFVSDEVEFKDNSDDIVISVTYLQKGDGQIITENLLLPPNSTYSESFNISEDGKIFGVLINGNKGGCDYFNTSDELCWLYLPDNDTYLIDFGLPDEYFGEDKSNETEIAELTAITSFTTAVTEEIIYHEWTYVKCNKSETNNLIRYQYVPSLVNQDSPDYIVCYEGENPNLLYRTYDMNAFIWYSINRGNLQNQIERNHLMWDNRISLSLNSGAERVTSEEWNNWYNSKLNEGDEFKYLINGDTLFYPIIEIEPYNSMKDMVLIRIPAQTYFLPRKRMDIIEYGMLFDTPYFNASIYKFNWDYLSNIQILNPRLLLVRLIENLLGFTLDTVSNAKMDFYKTVIKGKLSKIVTSIIEINDMEVEDCWKSFSNEDFNELIENYIYAKYNGSKYNGESVKVRVHDVDSYLSNLNEISENAKQEGTKTMITRMVNNIMTDPGIEPSTDWNFSMKFDSNLLNRLIQAIVMPIVESLFTPQVLLLLMINFDLMGIVKMEDSLGNDFGKVINMMVNKLLGLMKSLVLFFKDKIVSLLLEFVKEKIKPIVEKYALLTYLEHITDWLVILLNAVKCIPLMLGIDTSKPIGYIDEVDYADIVNDQNVPESVSEC